MQLLDGKALSKKIETQVTSDVQKLKESCGCTPGLAVVLVGQDPASAAYVNMKKKGL
jgi:methylenetetrahydrofolate dehydrogenase (NADP+)/methenyltetrahydrofolate cyclohydrolase